MEGITNVEQTANWTRISLEVGFYLVLNSGGLMVCREDEGEWDGVTPDSHAHLDWEAAGQIAATIGSAEGVYGRTEAEARDDTRGLMHGDDAQRAV